MDFNKRCQNCPHRLSVDCYGTRKNHKAFCIARQQELWTKQMLARPDRIGSETETKHQGH